MRAAASSTPALAVEEELSRVDPSVGVLVDVRTPSRPRPPQWGNDDIKQRYLGGLAAKTVGAYALSEAGSGSAPRPALTTRARPEGEKLRHHRTEALDYQRQRADLFIVFDRRPVGRVSRHHRLSRRPRTAGLIVGKKEDKLGIAKTLNGANIKTAQPACICLCRWYSGTGASEASRQGLYRLKWPEGLRIGVDRRGGRGATGKTASGPSPRP